MATDQTMISIRAHNNIVAKIDELIPSKYTNRSEFLIAALREKFKRDGITIE